MSIDLEQFKEIFFEESFEGLDAMETCLLQMEGGNDDLEIVNTVFRAAHSIKGGSATFSFTAVASFTHVMEGLLDDMREGNRAADQEVVNILLQSVDLLRELLTTIREGGDVDESEVSDLKEALQVLRGGEGAQAVPEKEVEAASEKRDIEEWEISFSPDEDLLQTGNDPALLFRELAMLGELSLTYDASRLPDFEAMDAELAYLQWKMTLKGCSDKAAIEEIFEWVEDECDLEITAVQPDRRAEDRREGDRRLTSRRTGSRREKDPQKSKAAAASSSIRVGTDRIDTLIDLVGELVITQSMLSQLGEDFSMDKLENLKTGLGQLSRNSRQLQESVMSVRMQPISFAFNRFPRMVHDLSQKLGKIVRLETTGEDTEMDKTVMEKINDPLVHLVRNSMDHGLETPEERRAAGKPEEGVVHLSASHQGGNIVVEITDDGRGLNRDKILSKAIERGLVQEEDDIPDQQIYNLVFLAGFSTADSLSDVSGRGVGMDVVRRNIESLGGSVVVRSTPGKGSIFTITLPLTLAILDGQLINIKGQTMVLPLGSIIESLIVDKTQLNAMAGESEVYSLRDEYIPIIRLSEVFDLSDQQDDLRTALLVVVESGQDKVCFVVDDLLAQQQVVIKSMESNFCKVGGVSGATILGDGNVSLIIDVNDTIRLAKELGMEHLQAQQEQGNAKYKQARKMLEVTG
ncbi:MAG: chemotaxis protein CheA [Mariprofundaceae bacterium]|nr:chemotaxis protein CheA [Mariprofundaceae bacterium]